MAGSSAASPFEITCGVSSIAGTIWIILSIGSDIADNEYINNVANKNFIFLKIRQVKDLPCCLNLDEL